MNQSSKSSYSRIAESARFRLLMSQKKRFIMPMSLFFLVFYFVLPIMTSYSAVLNQSAFGPITWAWVFAFAQFIMTWILCSLYTRKARAFDAIAEQIKAEAGAAKEVQR
ncbi:DUF485 domain-containing protein [Paenibacillus ginsengihumi]|jgi:uncharacterized membrane protein (DUF485 family)|uniref:DUF485 domain-containing protein n=1 Tax=Paenibacillus ginsengihumi TaxID=431596 RepID=UPI000364794C|nr:DUF485 domain-containing protein [Paenibacillus ginsengihumi]